MKGFFALFGITICLMAKTNSSPPAMREFQIKIHNINQVEMCISNFGKFGQNETTDAGLWWPKGSGHNYIYGAGFWFSTIDSLTGDTLVTVGYEPHGAASECGPGLSGMPVSDTNAIIYLYPENWPPPQSVFPMAPQIPMSHQDSWCCMNDSDITWHIPGDTRPIGIELYQTVYVWNIPTIEDMVFMTYQIKNVSGHNLKDCYFGICTDCDVGNEGGIGNDQCTAIIEKPYFIDGNWYIIDNLAYQWQEVPEPGWPSVGAIGFDLLQTPFDLQPGQDKDNDGILDQYERDSAYYVNNLPPSQWDVDYDYVPDWRDASENPQLGLTAFKIFTLNLEPGIDPERYLTLAGYNYETGAYEPYDTIIPLPDDQRFLMSTGPFDLAPDSIFTTVFAIVLADYGDDATPPAETCLVLADWWAQYAYNMSWHLFSIEENSRSDNPTAQFAIYPNPVCRDGTVSFALSKSGLVTLKLYNPAGQLVKEIYKGYKPAGKYNINFHTKGFAQGMYFIVLETQTDKISRSLVILR